MYIPIIFGGKPTDYSINEKGIIKNVITGKKMKPGEDPKTGRPRITLRNIFDVKRGTYVTKSVSISVLVATAFVPNPYNKPQVHHIDHDPWNNKASNLMWVTAEENMMYEVIDPNSKRNMKPEILSIRKKTKHKSKKDSNMEDQRGEKNFNVKYTEDQIRKACKLLENPELKHKYIAEKTGLSIQMVRSIKARELWTSVSNDYDIPMPRPEYNWKDYYPKIVPYLSMGMKPRKINELLRPDGISKEEFRIVIKHAREKMIRQNGKTTRDGLYHLKIDLSDL